MVKITWKDELVPKDLKITQVYGIVFNNEGKILLKVENKKGKKVYSFAGGTPEDFDKDVIATLDREMLEEVNTTLEDEKYYLGYQLIENDGEKPPYAQVRMTALIKNIGKKQPDPDNNEIYDRVLVSPKKAVNLLNWAEVGKLQIEKAVDVITQNCGIKINEDDEEILV